MRTDEIVVYKSTRAFRQLSIKFRVDSIQLLPAQQSLGHSWLICDADNRDAGVICRTDGLCGAINKHHIARSINSITFDIDNAVAVQEECWFRREPVETFHAPVRQMPLSLLYSFGRTNILCVFTTPIGIKGFGLHQYRKNITSPIGSARRWDVVQRSWRENIKRGTDKIRQPAFLIVRLRMKLYDTTKPIHRQQVTIMRVVIGMDEQRPCTTACQGEFDERGKVDVKQDIAIDDDEGFRQIRCNLPKRTGRPKRRGFGHMADVDTKACTVTKMILDHRGKMTVQKDEITKTRCGNIFDYDLEQRLPANRHHRLWYTIQPQSCSLSSAEHNDLHRCSFQIARAAARIASSDVIVGCQPSEFSADVSYSNFGTSPIQPRSPPV
ncbi:hypothetical protein D3C80_1058780 [compost metagenome]